MLLSSQRYHNYLINWSEKKKKKKKTFLFHLIYWNGNKSSILLYLLVHILYHLIFVSLLYAYNTTENKGWGTIEDWLLWEQ